MVNCNDFLRDFAEKFGETEEDKERIRSSEGFYVDYLDGLVTFYRMRNCSMDWTYQNDKSEDPTELCREFTYNGGNNGSIFKSEDYWYLWDNLIMKQDNFVYWFKSHNFTEDDMMSICGEFYGEEGANISCQFYFYIERFSN